MHEEMTVEVKDLTKEQILSGCNLIAAYMKTKRMGLRYHENWGLIMPVVVKLQDKHNVEITIYYRNTKIQWNDEDDSYDTTGTKSETKLLSIFNAIVRFLTWVKEDNIDLDNPVFYD